MAYNAPGVDPANAFSALLADPGPWGRDLRCRRRSAAHHPWYPPVVAYELIRGNEELAQSIRRFIPWVRNSADLATLVDCYVTQNRAKRILRYQYVWDNQPTLILGPAMALADRSLTDPWLEWLFSRAYIYPLPPSGLQDLISTANDRDGAGYIGSWYYSHGEEASKNGEKLAGYIAAGGDPKYDLRDPKLYPKITAGCYWPVRTLMAGKHFPRIGDVCGPDKPWGHTFRGIRPQMSRGWKWTQDSIFAWMLKNEFGRKGESDEEWQGVEKAAGSIERAPYLTQPSRVIANWCGVLETGTEHDDSRFRRAVMLRIGQGYGHHHYDTLDLQVYAHGHPMTVDGGQRPGYSKPSDRTTRIHNVVEVDNQSWWGHSWVKALSDAEGARYMQAEAVPPVNLPNVKFHRRQVALIDVDEGLLPEGARKNPKVEGVVSPNSYVSDVVRVSGGTTHTYCFHAMLDDEMQVNVENRQSSDDLPEADQNYLSVFVHKEKRFGGDAPDTVVATWRMKRGGYERGMNPAIWNEKSPRKYTRMHLLGQKGARALSGWFWCRQWGYGWQNLHVQHRSETDRDMVFPAVIEPYAGQPFIDQTRVLPVTGNDTDASRAVAIEVKTTNGHTDVLFTDGRPGKARKVGNADFAGEFAFISMDGKGLRQASLTGGTLLESPLVTLKPSTGGRSGKVTKADYLEKTFWIDQPWPAFEGGEFAIEVGSGAHWTTYMVTKVKPEGKGSTIAVRNGADLFASRIRRVDEQEGIVYTSLSLPFQAGALCPGLDRDLVASNEDLTKFWRAENVSDLARRNFGFKLTGGPVKEADFGRAKRFRIWEYGVGDTVRKATFVSLRRTADRAFELSTDVDVTVAVKGSGLEISPDQKTWKALKTSATQGKAQAIIKLASLQPSGRCYVRVK